MSEILTAAAEALGIPEALVERSAAARAQETGMSVDEVLAAWAGGGPVAAQAKAPPAAAEPAEPSPEDAPEDPASPQPVAVPVTAAPVVPGSGVPAVASRAAPPSEVTPAQAANLPEVVTVPTAGIREKTNFAIPRWLVAVMLIIPAFALFTLGGSATGTCGEATELTIDVVTGAIVNCDGSEFTGSGVGGGSTDFIAQGQAIYAGTGAAGVNCAACHGANGGGGVGPALNGVLTVFGRCGDHAEWVSLGTPGFQAAGRGSYGDTNKTVSGGGIMPPHPTLSEEQLAAVTAFERVRFGGADVETTLTDCGLVEEPADGGDGTGEPGSEEGPPSDTETGDETPTETAAGS